VSLVKRVNGRAFVLPAPAPRWHSDWRLQLESQSIPNWTEQYHFAVPWGRKWAFDFAWPTQRLAVELEGGIWRKGGGAHSHPLGIERDIDKYNHAMLTGWRVLRVTSKHVKSGEGYRMLLEALG
jgi:hypothetical protein